MSEEQLDDYFAGLDLRGQPAQTGFVIVSGHTKGQLFPELLGQPAFEAKRDLIVEFVSGLDHAHGGAKFISGQSLHPDQETTRMPITAGPRLDLVVQLFPSTEIEVSDTKVTTIRQRKSIPQGGQQRLFNVVKYSWHQFFRLRPAPA